MIDRPQVPGRAISSLDRVRRRRENETSSRAHGRPATVSLRLPRCRRCFGTWQQTACVWDGDGHHQVVLAGDTGGRAGALVRAEFERTVRCSTHVGVRPVGNMRFHQDSTRLARARRAPRPAVESPSRQESSRRFTHAPRRARCTFDGRGLDTTIHRAALRREGVVPCGEVSVMVSGFFSGEHVQRGVPVGVLHANRH